MCEFVRYGSIFYLEIFYIFALWKRKKKFVCVCVTKKVWQ